MLSPKLLENGFDVALDGAPEGTLHVEAQLNAWPVEPEPTVHGHITCPTSSIHVSLSCWVNKKELATGIREVHEGKNKRILQEDPVQL